MGYNRSGTRRKKRLRRSKRELERLLKKAAVGTKGKIASAVAAAAK
jgi:hypothetical protein